MSFKYVSLEVFLSIKISNKIIKSFLDFLLRIFIIMYRLINFKSMYIFINIYQVELFFQQYFFKIFKVGFESPVFIFR